MEDCLTVTWIKNWLYVPAFLMAIGFPDQTAWLITSLAVLMVIDTISGVMLSGKIDGLLSITSRKLAAGVVSKSLILLIPFMFAMVAKGFGINFDVYLFGTVGLLVLAELYSVLGNIQSYRTGKRLPEIDVVSLALSKIRKAILSLLEKTKID